MTNDDPGCVVITQRTVGDYYLSEAVWHTFSPVTNCSVACLEMGILNRKTNHFVLFQHDNPDHEGMLDKVEKWLGEGVSPEEIVLGWDNDV